MHKSEYRQPKNSGTISLSQELELNRNNKFLLDASYRYQDTTQESNWANLKTLYLQSRYRAHRFSLGQQQVVWEATDIINPFDFVHQKNLQNPLLSELLSSPTVHYTYSKGSHIFNAFYIPEQVKSMLPDTESPWLPRSLDLPIQTDSVVLRTQPGFSFRFLNEEVLNDALRNQVGVRYKFVGDSFDLSLVGYEGAKNQPLIFPTVTGTLLNDPDKLIILLDRDIALTPVYYRNRVGGFATTLTVGSYIFRFASSYHQPIGEDDRIPGWNYLSVSSIEKTFELGNSVLTIQLLASGGQSQDANSIASLSSLYESATGIAARFAYKENFSFISGWVTDIRSQSVLQNLQAEYKFNDYFKVYTQAFFIDGSKNLLTIAYKENDFAQAGFKISY